MSFQVTSQTKPNGGKPQSNTTRPVSSGVPRTSNIRAQDRIGVSREAREVEASPRVNLESLAVDQPGAVPTRKTRKVPKLFMRPRNYKERVRALEGELAKARAKNDDKKIKELEARIKELKEPVQVREVSLKNEHGMQSAVAQRGNPTAGGYDPRTGGGDGPSAGGASGGTTPGRSGGFGGGSSTAPWGRTGYTAPGPSFGGQVGNNGSNIGSLYSGPAGNVGNVNVENLVNAIEPPYRPSARKHWPAIVAEANKQGITNKGQLAYILATTVHESGAGKHMEEFASGSAYEGRADLGNSRGGDGQRFKGRGYVQITGRRNYTDWSRRLGIDLVNNPAAAKQPEIAAKILVGGMKNGTFTGKRLDQFINGSKTDFIGARRIVNGTDKAAKFARTAQRILRAMGG